MVTSRETIPKKGKKFNAIALFLSKGLVLDKEIIKE